MNSPKPLTISNVSSAGYAVSNVVIGPPMISNPNIYLPRRGSNGFAYTPSATFVDGSVNYIEPQFPPLPVSNQMITSANLLHSQQALIRPVTPPLVPSLVTHLSPVNKVITTIQPVPIIQASNIYAIPMVATTYTNLALPMRNSIAGFSFPEMMNQNVALAAGSDYQRLPTDASFSKMSTKVICPRCGQVSMTNVQVELGCASYCWCLTLLPLACTGLCCLCLPECKDRVHYCSCGQIVGYHKNAVC